MPSNNENVIVGSGLIWDPPKVNFSKFVFDKLKQHGSRIALINDDNDFQQTFEQLRILSVRTAMEMQARGITKGDIVACYSKNYILLQYPILATFFLGGTCLPMHSTYSPTELKAMLRMAKPKIIFCDDDFEMKVKNTIKELNISNEIEIVNLDNHFEIFMTPKHNEDNFEVTEIEDVNRKISVLLGTSGSSGLVKSVPLTYRSFFVSINTIHIFLDKDCYNDTILTFAPLSWSSGLKLLVQCSILGVRRVIAKPNMANQIKALKKYQVNIFASAPNTITSMIHHPDFAKANMGSQMRQILYGGTAANIEQTTLFRTTFPNAWCFNGYGSAEMCGLHAFFYPDDPLNAQKQNACGKLINEMCGKIIDVDSGQVLGRNQLGEILLKSPYMMTCYYKDPKTTKDAIDSDGWFHTGDLGYFDDDNCLFCIDRLKETFKYFNIQVSPIDIESVLQQCPGIQSVCVVGKKDPACSSIPVAFIIVQKGFENLTADDIHSFAEDKLMDCQKLRGGIRFVTQFPMTVSGKVKRLELRKMLDNE